MDVITGLPVSGAGVEIAVQTTARKHGFSMFCPLVYAFSGTHFILARFTAD